MGCIAKILLAVCAVALFEYAESGTTPFQCYRCKTCSGDKVCNRFPIANCETGLTACGIVLAQKWNLFYVAKFCMNINDAECAGDAQVWFCDYHYLNCKWCCHGHSLCNVKTPYPPKPTKPAPMPGPKGDDGPQGPKGIYGPPGEAGARGPPGPPGDGGPRGPPGLTGSHGPDGDKGKAGGTGPPGGAGPPGPHGPAGPKGNPGPKGITGPPGDKGDQGPLGPQGAKGMNGLRGDPGLRGIKGAPGDPGVGPKGVKGADGPDGPDAPPERGSKGEKGNKGNTGPKGFKGEHGAPVPCECPDRAITCFTVIGLDVKDAAPGTAGLIGIVVDYDVEVSQVIVATTLPSGQAGISGFGDGQTGPMIFTVGETGVYIFQLTSVSSVSRSVVVYLVVEGADITHTGRREPNANPYPMGNIAVALCLKHGVKVKVVVREPIHIHGTHFGYGYHNFIDTYNGDPSRVTWCGCLMAQGICIPFKYPEHV